jgi:tetratricopeptide (TPR) repeat protein
VSVSGQQNRTAKGANKVTGLSEDRLRIRLQVSPHDADAHKALIDQLQKKNAFRAIVAEDITWLANNRSDSLLALTEIISYSEAALFDPELAITQLRLHLSKVQRSDDPEDFDNWSDQLAAKLQKRGRPEEALPLFAELVRLNPEEAGFWADYAHCLTDVGQHSEAAKAFRRSISLDSSMEVVHEGFGDALVRAGDLSNAESEYRAALSIYDAQYKAGEPTDSLHSFVRSMVKIEAQNKEEHALAKIRLKLAHALMLDKKYDDAITQSKAALEADHNQFAALYLEAEIYDAKQDHTQATKIRNDAEAAIRKEMISEGARKNISELGDPRVAFLFDGIWNEDSEDPAMPGEMVTILEPRLTSLSALERIALASAYFALGRVRDAKEQWEKSFSSDTKLDTAVSHARLGEQLVKASALTDALAHFQRAYELDPQNTTFRMEYEAVRQKLGR